MGPQSVIGGCARDWRIFLFGAAVAVAYWPGILGAAFSPRWAIMAAGLPLLFTLRLNRLPGAVVAVLAIMVMLGLLSIGKSPDPMAAIHEWMFLLILAAAFVAGSELETFDDIAVGLGAGLAVSSALCVAQRLGWSPVEQAAAPAGLFFNREVLAEFSALIFVWAALRPIYWIAAVALVPLLLCGSRVAALAVFVALLPVFWGSHRRLVVVAAIVICIGAVASLLTLGADKASSGEHRIVLWIATVMALHPSGLGLGWFQAAHPAEQFAHSDVLQAFAELGIGAAVLVVIPWTAWRNGSGYVAERAALVAVAVECLVSFPLHVPASAFMAAMLAGFLCRVRAPLCHVVDDGGMADEPGLPRQTY